MKKPVKLLIYGIVLFILGAFVLPLFLTASIFIPMLTADPNIQFLIPGDVEINVEEAGKYYLWNEYETVYEGETYSKPKNLPDNLKISMQKEDGTLQLNFVGDRSISISSGSSARHSIGYFEIAEAGDYILNVQGETDPRVFSFGISRLSFFRIVLTFLIGGTACLVFGIGGFALGVVGIVKMAKSK